jgi:hypothetical protein
MYKTPSLKRLGVLLKPKSRKMLFFPSQYNQLNKPSFGAGSSETTPIKNGRNHGFKPKLFPKEEEARDFLTPRKSFTDLLSTLSDTYKDKMPGQLEQEEKTTAKEIKTTILRKLENYKTENHMDLNHLTVGAQEVWRAEVQAKNLLDDHRKAQMETLNKWLKNPPKNLVSGVETKRQAPASEINQATSVPVASEPTTPRDSVVDLNILTLNASATNKRTHADLTADDVSFTSTEQNDFQTAIRDAEKISKFLDTNPLRLKEKVRRLFNSKNNASQQLQISGDDVSSLKPRDRDDLLKAINRIKDTLLLKLNPDNLIEKVKSLVPAKGKRRHLEVSSSSHLVSSGSPASLQEMAASALAKSH